MIITLLIEAPITPRRNNGYLYISSVACDLSLFYSFVVLIFKSSPKTYGIGMFKSTCSLNSYKLLPPLGYILLQLVLKRT